MEQVEAEIKIHNAGLKHFAIAVMILAGLLTAFFWLGFWAAELRLADQENPAGRGLKDAETRAPITAPSREKPSPIEKLKIDPNDGVRL